MIKSEYKVFEKAEFHRGDACPIKSHPELRNQCWSNDSPFCEHTDESCYFKYDIIHSDAILEQAMRENGLILEND